MEKLFNQFKEVGKQVVLTKDEKSQERGKLLSFMSTHPVRSIMLAHQPWTWSNLNFNFLSTGWQRSPIPIFVTIVLALSVMGGVAMASQNALPGDTLYSVKLKTEEIRSVLAFSTENKAKLEVELAQHRLKEAEELSSESKLDTGTRIQLENSFENHANRAAGHTKKLASVNTKAASDINSNLETSLKEHAQILSKLATTKDGKVEPEINKLLIKVRSETEDANKNKNDEGGNIKVQTPVNIQSDNNLKVDVRSHSVINGETESVKSTSGKILEEEELELESD